MGYYLGPSVKNVCFELSERTYPFAHFIDQLLVCLNLFLFFLFCFYCLLGASAWNASDAVIHTDISLLFSASIPLSIFITLRVYRVSWVVHYGMSKVAI